LIRLEEISGRFSSDGTFGIQIDSIALNKYYSSRKVLKLFGKRTSVYLIPKKNIPKIGLRWVRIFKKITENPVKYLKNYLQRNLSETVFSATYYKSFIYNLINKHYQSE